MLLESSIMRIEMSITLLQNIYNTGITHDDHNMFIELATGANVVILISLLLSLHTNKLERFSLPMLFSFV